MHYNALRRAEITGERTEERADNEDISQEMREIAEAEQIHDAELDSDPVHDFLEDSELALIPDEEDLE
ncbi:hypothetical protein Aduo_012810 [Ancylostoma duodenale]